MGESPSLPQEFGLLRKALGRITDQRSSRGKVHPLEGVLSLTVLALMCGQRSLAPCTPPPPADRAGIETQSVIPSRVRMVWYRRCAKP